MRFDPASFQPEHYLWEFENGVATITLNRPERKNALNHELFPAITAAVRDAAHDDEVWALAITGKAATARSAKLLAATLAGASK